MTKNAMEKQVERLEKSVDGFVESIAAFDDNLFLDTTNGWSARDIAAHLIGWNLYIIKGGKQILRGELPFYDIDPGENYSKINAAIIREYSSPNKQKLIDGLKATLAELKQFLLSLSIEEWPHDYGVRHKEEVVTIQSTIDDLIEDYHHHKEQLYERG